MSATTESAVLEGLLNRASAPRLIEPAPSKEDLETIFRAAANAPDHGKLRPWRFIVVGSDARDRFGELMVETLKRREPSTAPEWLQREKDKAMRAPTIVVVAAKVTAGGKIPEIEQILAVAASAENMILAAHALGYGTMWKTGAPAYDGDFKKALGLEATDHIVGFIYLGTNATGRTLPRDIKLDGVVSYF